MSDTLIAVVVALAIGHTVPTLGTLRRFDWFITWIAWLGEQLAEQPFWRSRWALALVVGVPALVVGLLQLGLHDGMLGLPALVFAILVLFYAWGPRDLDLDVEAVAEARDPVARQAAAARLFPEREAPLLDGGSLVEAVFRCALWRWFGVLFWFLLLGPFGALLYRLVALCAQGEARKRLPPEAGAAAQALLTLADWPVAQLMTLAMALAGNFDAVFNAWKDAGGASPARNIGFLAAAARASVKVELAEEAMDYGDSGVATGGAMVTSAPELPELRDAMSLIWRILLLWLVVLALFVIAGWVS
jgi:AmpE protein